MIHRIKEKLCIKNFLVGGNCNKMVILIRIICCMYKIGSRRMTYNFKNKCTKGIMNKNAKKINLIVLRKGGKNYTV